MNKQLLVGTVLKPQGIRGEIKIKTYTDSPEDIAELSTVTIGGVEYKVLSARAFVGDSAFLTLRGVADRNAAELLRGKEVLANRSEIPPLPEGRYYISDLIGCAVFDEAGNSLGELVDVTPAKTDVYTVCMQGRNIPFACVEGVVLSVDVEGKKMIVDRKKFEQVAVLD
jgi:16S rRNA processing protein RimM